MLKESGAIERACKDFRKDEVGHTGIMGHYVVREVLLREREMLPSQSPPIPGKQSFEFGIFNRQSRLISPICRSYCLSISRSNTSFEISIIGFIISGFLDAISKILTLSSCINRLALFLAYSLYFPRPLKIGNEAFLLA